MKIISRGAWGARPWVRARPRVAISERRWFLVHYHGGPVKHQVGTAVPRNVEVIHLANGWSGTGYNFMVDQNGAIYEGAGWDLVGAHCPGRNRDGIGVYVAVGGSQKPSDAALRSVRWLYDELARKTGRQPVKSYHRANYSTECPGPHLIAWVKAGMPSPGGSTSPAPETPTPKDFLDMNEKDAAAMFRKIVREEIDRRLVQKAPDRFQNEKKDKVWANATYNAQIEADTARTLAAVQSVTHVLAPARFQNEKGDKVWTAGGILRQIEADTVRGRTDVAALNAKIDALAARSGVSADELAKISKAAEDGAAKALGDLIDSAETVLRVEP